MAKLRLLTTESPHIFYLHDPKGQLGEPLFGIHHYVDDEGITDEGYWFMQDTGILASAIPDSILLNRFAKVEDAIEIIEKRLKEIIDALTS